MNQFKIRAKQDSKINSQSLKMKIQNQNRRVQTETDQIRNKIKQKEREKLKEKQKEKEKQKQKEKPTRKINLTSKNVPGTISWGASKNTTLKIDKVIKKPTQDKVLKQVAVKSINSKVKSFVTQPYQKAKTTLYNKRIQSLFNKKPEVSKTLKQKSFLLKQPTGVDKYSYDQEVGSGTFGVVYKGRNKVTLQTVAIKKVLQDRKYKNREGQILKILNHYNVLKMKDSFFTQEKEAEYLNVVMDYFPDTAYSVIRKHNKKNPIPPTLVKIYAYQLFRSLLYLNKIQICHRDIKPHNILVDQQTNKLVMCDFGSAKKLVKGEPNIAYICSRCYRAPELIFGATDYSTQIDMWSAGCVVAEMLTFQPLFVASNNIDQLVEVIKSLGTPSEQEILSMNPQYDMDQFRFPDIPARDWKKIIRGNHDPLLIDLIKGTLRYSPQQRLTPFQALTHPYFDDIRNPITLQKMKEEFELPCVFNFSKEQCTKSQLQLLQPQ